MDKIKIKEITLNCSNVVLLLIVLFSAFRATIFTKAPGLSDRIFLILIPLFLCTFMVQFFLAERAEKLAFLKSHILVIVYLGIRCMLFVLRGFNHYIFGSIIYETAFLLLICFWTVGSYEKVKKIFAVFIGFNLTMNLLSAGSVILMKFSPEWSGRFAAYQDIPNYLEWVNPYAWLFLNPNNAGIMTAMALCLLFFLVKPFQKRENSARRIIGVGIYLVFSLYMMYQYSCRSAYAGIIIVFIIYSLVKVFKWRKRRVMQVCLAAVIAFNVAVIAVIAFGVTETSEHTEVVNLLSTGRLQLWNDSYHTAEFMDSWLLGQGSNELEIKNRNTWTKEQWKVEGYDVSQYVDTTLGTHNGFLGILFNAGIICFILFVVILWQKIRRMPFGDKDNWYLIVIFALTVNLFESLLIMNRSYVCFLMMIVLAMGDVKEMKPFGEKDESESIDYHSGI